MNTNKIRYMGKEISYSETYRPDSIIVDGVEMSMTRFAKQHGWNWASRADGNVLYYAAEDGSEISIPQKRFQLTDEEWKELNYRKRKGLS